MQPHISLPSLMTEFETYGQLSNSSINFLKSVAMRIAISPSLTTLLQTNFPFQWTTLILYFGTDLHLNSKKTFAINFPLLLNFCKTFLDQWYNNTFFMVLILQRPQNDYTPQIPILDISLTSFNFFLTSCGQTPNYLRLSSGPTPAL